MVASDSRLLHDGIERIFAPLGVRLRWIAASSSCKFGVWRLFSKQDPSGAVVLETSDKVNILGYRKLETLRCKLCSEISKIWIDRHYVANPYLGCRSLEEMQIRCDLLGASSEGEMAANG